MSYIDGFVAAVPSDNREAYIAHAKKMNAIMLEHGATGYAECWGEDVPEGEVTSFPKAVQRKEDETVVFAWIIWPDKDTRDAGWKAIMEDPRMTMEDMPFDGKRMIYGGFEVVAEVARAAEAA